MNNLSLREVYDALSRKIKETYPDKRIFGSTVYQSLDDESFNIIPLSVTDIKGLGTRVKRQAMFDCIYYSETYENLLEVANILTLSISTIKATNGQIVHGFFNNPTTEIVDGALHCIVKYEYFGLITEVMPEGEEGEIDLMYYLKQNNRGELNGC